MRKQLYIAAALQLTFCWVLPAQSSILFETTTPPTAGQPSGGTISTTQYVGNYFVLTAPAHVDSISTAASVQDNGTIFGAILPVSNLGTLPTGTPFGVSGSSAPLITALLKPNAINTVVSGAAPVDLPAGTYVLVFGTGQYGASSGTANLEFSDGVKQTLPTGANQVNYGPSCNSGTTPCWSSLFGAPSPFFFAISGTSGAANITSLNPNFAAPGGAAFTLTVNGGGFQPTSTIAWGGTTLATTYVNSSQLTTTVPSNLISAAGSTAVTVSTNGVPSNAMTFVIGASNGPSISSISPTAIPPGSAGFTLTVNGSGFVSGAVVLWNGSFLITNFNSSSQLTASVGTSLLGNGGTVNVAVQNPNNGGTSNSVIFVVGSVSNIPTLTSVTPSSATVGAANFTLTLNGANFTNTSAVQWNNTLLATTYLSPTQLAATVPANLLTSAASVSVAVNNPGAGTSNSISFPIISATGPSITSLSPASVAPGGAQFTLTVNGSNFTNSSAVLWNNALVPTTYLSATQLAASISGSLITSAGTANVSVSNPGGVNSAAQTFTISASPAPVLSSLSPSSATPGGPQFTLTVNGSNFTQNSAILWNGSLQFATNFVNNTQLTATVPSNLIASGGTANVTVTTPLAGTSGALSFAISAPTGPTISSLSPSTAVPGGGSFIMNVNGSGFTTSSVVQWNNSQLVTIFLNANQLQASVSSTLIASSGVANVTVVTGTTTSSAAAFTIGTPNTPVLVSLSPNSATVGGAAFTLTVNGSNFANGATVAWNGGLLSTTFVSATQLTASVAASLVAATGTATVTVINPSGTNATSNVLNFNISNAASPTISSLSPGTINAGAAQFTLTVNGQGFLNGAAIRWNGAALASTTFVSSTQLTAIVPNNLITSPGTATITVANQGSSISNSLTFTITSSSNSTTIFQTTLPPTPGQPGYSSLSSIQFLGNYFVLSAPAHIDSIGTYAQASDGGTIFGAIMSVPSLGATPTGVPFDGTLVASATLRPSTTSSIVTAPVSVDLPAGTYAIVFGSGYLGATSTNALAAFSNGGSANVPTGWNQISWGMYCSGGLSNCWSANFASPSQFYFAVTGTSTSTAGLSISSLNPAAVTAGSATFSLTVNGTGFTNTSTVQWNGSSLATTYLSPTQLTASVSANLVANVGQASVTVLSANTISNASTFTISSPVTSITSLNPASAAAGGQAFTLTINGSGFANGSTLQWNGQALTTTFVNSTQLTANVPANLIASNGTASLTVLSPGGLFSNFIQFTVGSSTATISSLNPNSLTVGSAGFTLLVNGSGFLNGATVVWNGTSLATTYVNSTQLSVAVPSNLLANVGSYNLLVQNPNNGGTSNAIAFIVTPVGGGNPTAGLAHYAVGSNFTTGIFVINTGSSAANYSIAFYDDNGNPSALPFATGTTSRLTGSLPAYGSTYIEATNPNGPLTSGWGQITADSSIVVQSLFRSTLNNTRYEASVESSTGSRAFELPFDGNNFAINTPLYTGIAISNLDSTNSAQVSCIARDSFGTVIPNAVAIPVLRPLGHWAGFQFPLLVGQRGTLDCTSTTTVAVVALRFIGTDTFSSLPVIKK